MFKADNNLLLLMPPRIGIDHVEMVCGGKGTESRDKYLVGVMSHKNYMGGFKN